MGINLKRILFNLINKPSLLIHRAFNNNHDFSLITKNCVGGFIYHQYGLKFLSPTINLYFNLKDFCIFCNHLRDYVDGHLIQITPDKEGKPRGNIVYNKKELPPIKVHFLHYASFNDATAKWEERKKRINWNNIFVIGYCVTAYEESLIDPETIELFNSIPYKKVIFLRKNIGFSNEFIIKNPNDMEFYRKKFSWKYTFNKFNLNKFLRKSR